MLRGVVSWPMRTSRPSVPAASSIGRNVWMNRGRAFEKNPLFIRPSVSCLSSPRPSPLVEARGELNFPKKVLLLSVFRLLLLVENVPRNRVPVFDLSLSFSTRDRDEPSIPRIDVSKTRTEREREREIDLARIPDSLGFPVSCFSFLTRDG